MKSIQNIFVVFAVLLITGCNQQTKEITSSRDYEDYLTPNKNETLQLLKSDVDFWKRKIEKTPHQFPYYAKKASSHSSLFEQTGEIHQLIQAEKELLEANRRTQYSNSGYLRGLARNYISQHRFQESLGLLQKAELIGEQLVSTQKMLIDVYLELGNYKQVEKYLDRIKDFQDFDYLIRLSKYQDHLGKLESAIKYLEMSLEIAKASKNRDLLQWNYTNLADYYGHKGRIKDSYDSYLNALELGTSAYAMKGIAWIVYSHEKNPKEALRILDAIIPQNATPDYYLLKSEIAEFQQDKEASKRYQKMYLSLIDNEKYGVMYNTYKAELHAENALEVGESIQLADLEVQERPTAMSYDLLAWCYLKSGEEKKALEIAQVHVVGKTFEPTALLHTAVIYKANDLFAETKELKKELLDCAFELGPVAYEKVMTL